MLDPMRTPASPACELDFPGVIRALLGVTGFADTGPDGRDETDTGLAGMGADFGDTGFGDTGPDGRDDTSFGATGPEGCARGGICFGAAFCADTAASGG